MSEGTRKFITVSSASLVPVLSQKNPVRAFRYYSRSILILSYLRLVLPSCLFQVSLPKPCIPYVPYALPISFFSIAPRLHIMKFLITQFSSASVYWSLSRNRHVRLEISLMQLVCQCMTDGRTPKYACLKLLFSSCSGLLVPPLCHVTAYCERHACLLLRDEDVPCDSSVD
jgi:hypothetical protein